MALTLAEEMDTIAAGFHAPESYRSIDGFRRMSGMARLADAPGPVTALRICEGVIYATVGKKVFALKGADWQLAFTLD